MRNLLDPDSRLLVYPSAAGGNGRYGVMVIVAAEGRRERRRDRLGEVWRVTLISGSAAVQRNPWG